MKLQPVLVPTPESDLFDTLLAAFTVVTESEPIARALRERGQPVGGYLCIADETGLPMLIIKIGEDCPEKDSDRLVFCQEKARRLAAHPEHRLSWESRDPDKQMYGGAVRGSVKKLIVSFSGFPERVDELYALAVLFILSDASLNSPKWLARQGNEYAGTAVRFDRDFNDWLLIAQRG